jgi:hypothetical protein
MRTKVTLFLLFLNVALFFFIFHFERDWRTERAALEVRRRVLGPETAALRSIQVAATGGGITPYQLEQRGEESWFLTQPQEWPANLPAVHRIVSDLQLLENITSFSVHDVLKNGQSLADYGLDPPRMVVTLTSGGPEVTGTAPVTTLLRIGETTKADAAKGEQSVFVLSPDGARIHVVGRELLDGLSLPLDQLRSDTILLIPEYEARSLFLQATAPAAPASAPVPGPHVRLRTDRDGWRFEAPLPDARADKDATELALSGLGALRVKSFVANPPAGASPSANPVLSVTIDGNGRRETLFVGQPVEPAESAAAAGGDREYYAELEKRPALFTVVIPGPLMATLSNAQEALRDRHVLDFDATAVTAITLAAPSQHQAEITLQRLEGGTGWQIVQRGDGASGPQRADPGAVQALLNQLALLKATAFQSEAPQAADIENWGFNLPARLVTLSLAPGAGGGPTPQILLQIGVPTPQDDHAYARVVGTPSIYAVSPDILGETSVTPQDWRDRLLPFLPTGARITGLHITDLAKAAPVLEWKADGGIVFPAGAPAPETAAAVQDLIDHQLGALRASHFVRDAFSETEVKDETGATRHWLYQLVADLSLPAGAGGAQTGTATLWLTDRLSGTQQLAGSPEFKAVFAIEQPLLDDLFHITYTRDPGPLPPAAPLPPSAPSAAVPAK